MAKIQLASQIREKYIEVIPVLSGRGNDCSITLLGRRRDDPSRLDKILAQPWKQGDSISIVWIKNQKLSPQKV